MANISVTTLHSDCRSPSALVAQESSATGCFSSDDIPTPFDDFWNILGCPVIVVYVSKHPVYGTLHCHLQRRNDDPVHEVGPETKMLTPMFNLILNVDESEIRVKVNPEQVRNEVDYICKASVSARYNSAGITRKQISTWVQIVGCALRFIHQAEVREYELGIVTVAFEFMARAEMPERFKSPVTVDTTMQEMEFDKNRKCKVLTMKMEDSLWSDVNFGIFLNRHLELGSFELRYYHGIENVSETVLRCFTSNCVTRFEPFLELCDFVGVISNCENKDHQRITILTSAEHQQAHQWPVLNDFQNLRLICELEDQVLDIGLMLEVEPEFFEDRVDYTCKGTLLGGFLARTILKEWTDIFESAVAYLHNSSHSICKPYGEFKIIFYGDVSSLPAPSITSIPSLCLMDEVDKTPKRQIHFPENCSVDRNCVSPVLARKVVTRKRAYQTLVLKKKMILRNGKTIYFNSKKKHFDLVAFVRNSSEEQLNLDLLSTRTVLREGSKVVWPNLDEPDSPNELVILLIRKGEPVVAVITFKLHSENISYSYGISPNLGLSRRSLKQQESEIRDVVEDVVSHFHDLYVAPKGFSIRSIEVCDPKDENLQCLSKIALTRPGFRERWLKRLDAVLGHLLPE